MNRYMIVCRLRWPAILLLTGVIALLAQQDILSWGHAWPLYLILFGVLALAERAVLARDVPPGGYPYASGYPGGYPPQPGPFPGPFPGSGAATSTAPAGPSAAQTGIVPAYSDLGVQGAEPGSDLTKSRKSWEEEGR